jgi:hypothetical protein
VSNVNCFGEKTFAIRKLLGSLITACYIEIESQLEGILTFTISKAVQSFLQNP